MGLNEAGILRPTASCDALPVPSAQPWACFRGSHSHQPRPGESRSLWAQAQ